jgi:Mor family transcriptional regulator
MILENYAGILLPKTPINRITPTKCERNEEIRRRHHQGETLISIAEVFGLSENRVWQIVHRRRE